MSKTIPSLQDAIAREENQIGQTQDRLAELSIQVGSFISHLLLSNHMRQSDATIQSAMDITLSLLRNLGSSPEFVDTISGS